MVAEAALLVRVGVAEAIVLYYHYHYYYYYYLVVAVSIPSCIALSDSIHEVVAAVSAVAAVEDDTVAVEEQAWSIRTGRSNSGGCC